MIKLYDVVKYKTNVRGYWLNNGKLYIDNVNIKDYRNIQKRNCKAYIKYMFNVKKQLAIFYIKFNKAYIEDNKGNVTILKNRIAWKEKHITKDYLKALLLQHKGLTIYKHEGYFIIEIWRK